MEPDALEKTNRINMLFDFYGPLLTEKQGTILTYYFHDDFSLGEIAAEFGISRQAVYEHVKRGGAVLEEYEQKLGLLRKSRMAGELLDRLEQELAVLEGREEPGRKLRDITDALKRVIEPGNL
ncbi:YlxM family DNA-binding protein [Paenibacillus beijingensis]|uniref:UPF0122 protein VN24_20680 n=1 Tax=Paenibacillus beijingensis TaxID=1126833 RepID=A0A0D5NRD7_9BACL|nr:YlxM family DNA-binding protein [Paenibacillus beijingensis]AJY77894.1 DNA-binding protein [Paenibacillus beijingensis]